MFKNTFIIRLIVFIFFLYLLNQFTPVFQLIDLIEAHAIANIKGVTDVLFEPIITDLVSFLDELKRGLISFFYFVVCSALVVGYVFSGGHLDLDDE